MEKSIAIFAIINLTTIGVSHLLRPNAWHRFFGILQSHGEAGALANGFLPLATGSLIVAFHNIWVGLPVVLTILGWLYVVKAAVVFALPSLGAAAISGSQTKPAARFRAAGVLLLTIAAVCAFAVANGSYA